jgi:hypothetical protein
MLFSVVVASYVMSWSESRIEAKNRCVDKAVHRVDGSYKGELIRSGWRVDAGTLVIDCEVKVFKG